MELKSDPREAVEPTSVLITFEKTKIMSENVCKVSGKRTYLMKKFKSRNLEDALTMELLEVAAIAPWFHLRLPSCSPGFESQALHLRFFPFVIELWCEKDENKRKRGRDWPIFQKTMELLSKKSFWPHCCFQLAQFNTSMIVFKWLGLLVVRRSYLAGQ